MLKRFSNITLVVLCGLLVVGIIITRRVDTAIEVNAQRISNYRVKKLDYTVSCSDTMKTLVTADTAQWVRLQYVMPNFSSYNLDRKEGAWYIDNQKTDAQQTDIFLGKIANAQWRCSVIHNKPEVLKVADYELNIITAGGETLFYNSYSIDTTFIIKDHKGQLYYGHADSLAWQLYFGKHRFIPELKEQ